MNDEKKSFMSSWCEILAGNYHTKHAATMTPNNERKPKHKGRKTTPANHTMDIKAHDFTSFTSSLENKTKEERLMLDVEASMRTFSSLFIILTVHSSCLVPFFTAHSQCTVMRWPALIMQPYKALSCKDYCGSGASAMCCVRGKESEGIICVQPAVQKWCCLKINHGETPERCHGTCMGPFEGCSAILI